MLTPVHVQNPAIHGPLGGLLLGAVQCTLPAAQLRAFRWYHDLHRLGVHLPLFVVRDFGFILSMPEATWTVAAHAGSPTELDDLLAHYRTTLAELSESLAVARAREMRLSDDLVVVLLTRLLGPLARMIQVRPPYHAHAGELLSATFAEDLSAQLAQLYSACPRDFERHSLEVLRTRTLHLLTIVDAIDTDTIKLLALFGGASHGALGHVDLLGAFDSSATNDIVNFSLELLPSVLETTKSQGTGTHAVHGYAGMGAKGSVDSMVLTELAWDNAEFARRFIENETMYYTREQAHDEAKRLQYILVDASASMRGDREVFARGVTLALIKKLQLQGEEVWVRFFDSRLYDVHKVKHGTLPTAQLLGFKGERGRNPARVFTQLATELTLVRQREQRDPIVHLVTHAALHVPYTLMDELQKLAQIFGIFIVPSGAKLDLEYLDLLKGHAVVSHETLSASQARKAAGEQIVRAASAAASIRPPSFG